MRLISRYMLLFLAAFVLATVATIVVMREPLDPLTTENLADARGRWRDAGILDYRLTYTMNTDRYVVVVEDGIVMDATVNDQPVRSAELGAYSVDGLLGILELELENIADVAGRFGGEMSTALARIRFHPELGYIQTYLRSSGGMGRGAAIKTTAFEPSG